MSLGSEFTVHSVGGCCVRLSYGGKEGELLVTLKSGAIQVYNIHDFGLVCSWQLPTSEQVVCGAVADPCGAHYWAITSPQGLLQWSREDTTLDISTSHSLHPNPAQLLLCDCCPLIAYHNGDVEIVGGATTGLAPKRVKKWVLAMADVSHDTVCVVGRGKAVTVGVAEIAGGQLGQPVTTSLKGKGDDLVSSCLCRDKILLLFTGGEVWLVRRERPLQPVTCSHTLPSPLPHTHLVTLSSDYFILANVDSLQLWDSRYYTCQHCTNTTLSSTSKVWCVEGCVYMWSSEGGGLRGWRVDNLGVSTLSAALGKATLSSTQTEMVSSWPCLQEELDVWETAESASSAYVQALVNRCETPNLQTFMRVFSMQPLTLDVCYDDVIERLLSEKEFWGREVLADLLQANLVPSNVEVLSVAVTRDDWSIADMCLTYGPTPSEQSIVSMLQKLLSLSETLRCVSGSTLSRRELLYKVMCQPFNDVLIQAPLSELSLPVVKQLLLFLLDCVGVSSLLTPSSPTSSPTAVAYDMMLEWLALLLDVHFTRLTLDHQCRGHLLTLQAKVLAQVTCYSRLSCIFSLDQVQSKWRDHHSDRWLYKVQTVQL